MNKHTAVSCLTVVMLLVGAWTLQSTGQAAADAPPGKASSIHQKQPPAK